MLAHAIARRTNSAPYEGLPLIVSAVTPCTCACSRLLLIHADTVAGSATTDGGAGSGYWKGCATGTSLPKHRVTGPMSRVVSLYHAFENASSNALGVCANSFEIARYFVSTRNDTSAVVITTSTGVLPCAAGAIGRLLVPAFTRH